MTEHLPECPTDWCICSYLRACEVRVLDAAWEAVDRLPAPYKVRGDFDTYGPYNEGLADMKDSALAVIEALREKP